MTTEKRKDLIRQFSQAARAAHLAGDVVLRRQWEENIRDVASRAYAKKIISSLYKESADAWMRSPDILFATIARAQAWIDAQEE